MRKLKLQVQMTVDGYVAGPGGELDWMTWQWDDQLSKYVTELTDSVDTILLGRKMTDGFISYWSSVTDTSNPEYPFARKMCDYPKYVFTKTLKESPWENTRLATGEMQTEVERIKQQEGRDVIVYGGASFVSSLVKESLIDEYNLLVNPAVIGQGLSIFENVGDRMNLTLLEAKKFDCGINLLRYAKAGHGK